MVLAISSKKLFIYSPHRTGNHMKSRFLILSFQLLFVISELHAHKEWVHQYIVREAYWFLEDQIDYTIQDLKDHVGFGFDGYGSDNEPWSTGLIGVAAWREDKDDPIWGYGDVFDGWTASCTHFWKADNGDNVLTPITASQDVENAYKKARVYLFGGQKLFFKKLSIADDLGGIVILGRFYSYNSLVEFFKTGRCYFEGYIDFSGNAHFFTPVEVFMNIATAHNYAYQILGRVAHLLQDMSVPAHVQDNLHPCDLFDPDGYELYMGGDDWFPTVCNEVKTSFPAQNWNKTTAISQGGMININGMNDAEIIRYLFYTLNQLSDHFPSGRPSRSGYTDEFFSGNNNLPNGTNDYLTTRYNILGASPTSFDYEATANETFNFAIRATATLFYWFSLRTGLMPIRVPFDFANLPEALNYATTGQTVKVFPGTYDIFSNATVSNNITLEIQPGTTLRFKNNSRLIVNGKLIAIGESNHRIVFDGQNQVQTDPTNGLIKITGISSSDYAVIHYADIKGANCLVYANHPYGLNIAHSTFTNFGYTTIGYAFSVYDCSSSAIFLDNTVTGIFDGEFEHNGIITDATTAGGGSGMRIEGNRITNCFIPIKISKTNPTVYNNLIDGSHYGIYIINGSSPGIIYNVISNADYGVLSQNSSGYFLSNRISNNYIGMYLYNSSPRLRENFVGDNSGTQIICNSYSNPVFGGQGLYTRGYNKLQGTVYSPELLHASGYSYAELGIYDPSNEGNLSGYNSLIRNNPSGRHITATNASVQAQYNYFNLPIVTAGDVTTWNNLEYESLPNPYSWPNEPQGGGSFALFQPSNASKSAVSSKTNSDKSPSLLLTSVDARFDSAMRKRSKEEVLLALGASFCAKGMYMRAQSVFERIVKGEKRTKFDMPALAQWYGAYQKELYDTVATRVSSWLEKKNAFKQRLQNISVYNSDPKINDVTNLILAKEMMRFDEVDNAISAYNYIAAQSEDEMVLKFCLYDLLTIYLRTKQDTVAATNYLSRLEVNFPDDDLIAIARAELGLLNKNNRNAFSKSQALSKKDKQAEKLLPSRYNLLQNYPNPFNPTTTIQYQLPEDSYVTLTVYDIHGREVVRLKDGINSAGYYESRWDGRGKNNSTIASGLYFYRLTAKSLKNTQTVYTTTKKMLLLK